MAVEIKKLASTTVRISRADADLVAVALLRSAGFPDRSVLSGFRGANWQPEKVAVYHPDSFCDDPDVSSPDVPDIIVTRAKKIGNVYTIEFNPARVFPELVRVGPIKNGLKRLDLP